jgi:S1-C subfamily serine protease
MPMTVQRSAYGAGYFVKKHYRFGANIRDLSESERQQLQTNRGAYVRSVVDNTPAYNSDILPGDVIVGVNGQAANGYSGLVDLIDANRGRTVEVTVIRAGKTVSKQVSILE